MHNILNVIIGIIIGLLSLSLMMLLHELGHYVAGRLLGFKIVEFSLFMGPRLFSFVKNGIRYSLKSLPIGASVEFMGEFPQLDPNLNPNQLGAQKLTDENTASENRANGPEQNKEIPDTDAATASSDGVTESTAADLSQAEILARDRAAGIFYAQAKWKRFIVMAAGPAMNLLSGFLAFFLYFLFVGSNSTLLYQAPAYSKAATAGVQAGDEIISYNSFNIRTDLDLLVAERYPNDAGDARTLTLKRAATGKIETLYLKEATNKFLRLNIVVAKDKEQDKFVVLQSENPALQVEDKLISIDQQPFNGQARLYTGTGEQAHVDAEIQLERKGELITVTAPQDVVTVPAEAGLFLQNSSGVMPALKYAYDYCISVVKGSYYLLKLVFRGAVKATETLAGPVGIVNIYSNITTAAGMWSIKILKFIQVFALISLSLGIGNFIPLPPLDGSQIFLLGIEAIRGKRLSERAENIYGYIGLFLILGLALLTFGLDILRIFTK